jgi:hypothetical protein
MWKHKLFQLHLGLMDVMDNIDGQSDCFHNLIKYNIPNMSVLYFGATIATSFFVHLNYFQIIICC